VDESSRDVLEDAARPRTVGERLDGACRRIAARHQWTSPVAEQLGPALRRAEELAGLFAGRFDRDESGVDGVDPLQLAASAELPGWPPHAGHPAPDRHAAVRPTGEGRRLPADVRGRLREFAGPAADVLRVHEDAAADHVAKAHSADAVTVGADVYFRDGRFNPDEPEGFGLLAHEATHVSAGLASHGAARVSTGGRAAEENAALVQEQRAHADQAGSLRTLPGPAPTGRRGTPVAAPPPPATPARLPAARSGALPPAAAPAAGAVAMAAPVDRPAAPPAPFDVEALRRDLVVELMRRLRSDAERGA
jgi:hypothetical protein